MGKTNWCRSTSQWRVQTCAQYWKAPFNSRWRAKNSGITCDAQLSIRLLWGASRGYSLGLYQVQEPSSKSNTPGLPLSFVYMPSFSVWPRAVTFQSTANKLNIFAGQKSSFRGFQHWLGVSAWTRGLPSLNWNCPCTPSTSQSWQVHKPWQKHSEQYLSLWLSALHTLSLCRLSFLSIQWFLRRRLCLCILCSRPLFKIW